MGDETAPPPPRRFSPQAIHLVRTTQQAQYQLSQMADQKASMLMAATFVIFTISVSQARNGLDWPLVVLGGFAFASAVLAILAVLPATGARTRVTRPNPLFFGTFAYLSQEEHVELLLDTLATDESVYRAIAVDIHQNGRVLARKKYRLLGYAYRLFLAGLIASFATFVVVHLL